MRIIVTKGFSYLSENFPGREDGVLPVTEQQGTTYQGKDTLAR
jgi:hypothetical protein